MEITRASLFARKFTKELEENAGKTVYDLFRYKKVDALITDYKSGATILDMRGLEFPEGYSKNACNIIASKYFRKAGVGPEGGHETSMRQVADRMVGFWADALRDEGIIENDEQWHIFYDELAYTLLAQMWAPNSPQWFNTGIKRSYGISGDDDGLFYYDEKSGSVKRSEDRYTRTQASACFILSIADALIGPHSISETYVTETKLFKGGSGVGTNFSPLRAVNERLSSGGVSSGAMSFLKGFDRNAGAIKSGGTTRRAAKMVIMDIDHPEIENFITWKAAEEDKVRALGKMGYDLSMDGEAYATVSGQNGNNSVRVSESFMRAAMDLDANPNAQIALTGRKDRTVDRMASVKDLWGKIAQSAWSCADPALQFDDTFNAWHTCPAGKDGQFGAKHNRINATNPCSEYAFINDTSCNLASINIYRFYDPASGGIDLDSYLHVIQLCQLVLEASIHWGQFPTKDVAENTYIYRTTGLGIADAASLVMVMGYGYDSPEARNVISALASILTGYSYYVSSLMAERTEPFAAFSTNRPYMLRVLRNHARCAGALDGSFEGLAYEPFRLEAQPFAAMGREELFVCAKGVWEEALAGVERHGARNAQVSVIAPTGTISFAMDCGSTSIEPFYSHVVYKQLAGGGTMELVNPVIELSLEKLGYAAPEIEAIKAYLLQKGENGRFVHYSMLACPFLRAEHKKVFETANEISPEGHVLMVAAITQMISGAVSKTVNLVSSATPKDVENIYILAYRAGVKAISLYRDGCKATQPLNIGAAGVDKNDLSQFSYQDLLQFAEGLRRQVPERMRPTGMRVSRTHSAKIGDIELYVTIGFYENGKMAEMFVSTDKEGTVVKGLLASLSKAISNMLQYNVPPEEIARLLRSQQFEPSGFVSRHPYIKSASSIADLLSKIIEIEMGDFTHCQIKPADFQPIAVEMEGNRPGGRIDFSQQMKDNTVYNALKEKLYGEVCPNCNSANMYRNGTCKVCADCGTTTGCS
ncbi:MAG: vitamin B12-dependent ribonucleotide reductase [Eubacteriaceae bacterium]|nr:vitamin B12-dependent ribonucleotide reductase [Eubacteriaceae bacterium]